MLDWWLHHALAVVERWSKKVFLTKIAGAEGASSSPNLNTCSQAARTKLGWYLVR